MNEQTKCDTHTHTTGILALKRKEILIHVTTRMNLEDTRLSEIN